jgi:hypothetical protein
VATSAFMPAHLRDSLRLRGELFDRTTGLPGPVLLLDRIEMGLAHAKRRCRLLGVFYVDPASVDHEPPDLRALGEQLVGTVRPDDTVACDGAGHFVVVCRNLDHDGQAERVTHRLLDAIGAPCLLGAALGCPPTEAAGLIVLAMARATLRAGSTALVPRGRDR